MSKKCSKYRPSIRTLPYTNIGRCSLLSKYCRLQTQKATREILCIILQDCLHSSKLSSIVLILVHEIFLKHHHHHHQAHMELGHLLTRSGLTLLEVPLMASPGFFCLSVCSFLLSSVIYHQVFCLYIASNFFCIPAYCPKTGVKFSPYTIYVFVF
jgi:hypothetical protein